MEQNVSNVEAVTISDILGLATWNRQRSTQELQGFIDSRHATLPDDTEIE
ncbi:MAG: hypothetical protein WAZ21_00925 [Candidatus Saccharimonadales bacterium]